MSIPNNPLDWKMYRYCGMEVTAANFPEFDRLTAEEYLDNWMKKHPANYWLVGDRIKISITRRGEDLANRKIHSKHQKKYRVMK